MTEILSIVLLAEVAYMATHYLLSQVITNQVAVILISAVFAVLCVVFKATLG